MNRLDAMLDRLPPIYGIDEGTLLRQVLGVIAVDLATWDEDLDRVQRSHWVRTAFTRRDLERLAELVDVQAAPWESEDFFRARLVALTKARLDGAVTWAAIEAALLRILDSAGPLRQRRSTWWRPRPRASSTWCSGCWPTCWPGSCTAWQCG